jgi:TFIIF-interacting CTD phosphatase-like protein
MTTKPKKKALVLDLDHTLICSEDDFDVDKHSDLMKNLKCKDMDGYYMVFERPGLQKFLDFIFANFTVSVWTAASKDYALFIIEHMVIAGKKNRKLDWIFFSYHCDLSQKLKDGTKDLRMIWEEYGIEGYSKDNTVIIDDYDEVFATQPGQCIKAPVWEVMDKDSESDDFLTRAVPELKKMAKSSSSPPADAVNAALSKS